MNYNFKTVPDRRNTGSGKWEAMEKALGEALPEGVIPLSVADMELSTPPEIVAGLKETLDKMVLGYSMPTTSYRRAVCDWMARRHDWEIAPDWIVPYSGVVPALYTAVKAFTAPGDSVIIMTPVYYPFYSAVKNNGRSIVENPLINTGERYEIDFADLEKKAMESNNKLLILCSPHNPVGRVWTQEELLKVGEICLKYDVMVVSDEIHFDLILPGHKHTVLTSLKPEFADRWIVCTAPSKTFNLAGLQCSNIIIKDEKLREAYLKEAAQTGFFSVNLLGMCACEIAYRRCDGWLDELLILLDQNRKLIEAFMAEHLPEIYIYPLEGTYLQWWDCRKWNLDQAALEKFMQEKALLFLDEGYIFGKAGAGFERINIACPTETLKKALQRLKLARENL